MTIENQCATPWRAVAFATLLFMLVVSPAAGQEERVLVEMPRAVDLGVVTVGALDEQARVAAVAMGEWGASDVVLLDVVEDGLVERARLEAPGTVRWLGWSGARLLAWVGGTSSGNLQHLFALDLDRPERGWLDGGEIPGCNEEEPNAVIAGEQIFLRNACRDSWFYNTSQVHRFSVAGPGPPVLVDTPIQGTAYGPIAGGSGYLVNPRYGCDRWGLSGRNCEAPYHDIDVFAIPDGGGPTLKATYRRRSGFSAGMLSRDRLLSLPYHSCHQPGQLTITYLDPGWKGQRTVPRNIDCGATWIAEHDDRVLLGNVDGLWLTDLTFGGSLGKFEELPGVKLSDPPRRLARVELPARPEMVAVDGRVAFDLHVQTGGEVRLVPGSVAQDRAFLPALAVSR